MTMKFPVGLALTLLFSAAVNADTIFRDPFEIPQPVLNKVVITPGAKLLTNSGQSALLSARVVDQEGNIIAATVSWRSTNEAMVSVTSDGMVSALGSLGAAQIIAEAPGALRDVALVTIADPVDGALLIDDSQVVEPPVPADPDAEYGLGYEYSVILQGVTAPNFDDVLIGTGELPVAGRVTAVSKGGGDTTVTLRVVPLDELFDELVINERIDLSALPIDVRPELAQAFTSTRLSDGSLVLSPLQPETKMVQGTSIDPFLKCKSENTDLEDLLQISSKDDLILNPSFNLDLQYDSAQGGLQRLVVQGGIHAVYELQVRTKAEYEDKTKCKLELGSINIPMGFPWGLLFSGKVPLGVGVELKGKVSIAEPLGYDILATGNANLEVGVDCQSDCEIVANLDSGVDGTVHMVVPTLDEFLGSFQLDLEGTGFFFADLKFGNPFLAALQFTALGVDAGIKQSGSFRSIQAQVADEQFASSFMLELIGKAGASNDISKFLELLEIEPPSLTIFSVKKQLSESPKGSLVITDPAGGSSATPSNPAIVKPGNKNQLGDLARFEINLDPTTYFGLYNVEEVLVYWDKPDGQGGTTLELNRPGCNTFNPTSDQKQFTCQTDYLTEHIGEHKFYVFVKASLFGVPVPFPLEIAKDSATKLLVQSTEISYGGWVRASVRLFALETDEDFFISPLPVTLTAQVEIPGSGFAAAEGVAESDHLHAFSTGSLVGASRAETRGRAEANADTCIGAGATATPLDQLNLTLSGTVLLAPKETTPACAMLSVDIVMTGFPECSGNVESEDFPPQCRLEGEVYFRALSLNGETDCSTYINAGVPDTGVLVGYSGGQLSLQVGPFDLPPGASASIGANICVSSLSNATMEFDLPIPDLNQF